MYYIILKIFEPFPSENGWKYAVVSNSLCYTLIIIQIKVKFLFF